MNKTIIAGSSVYEKKYYFNPEFKDMPEEYVTKIKEWMIPTTEKIHGILTMGFYDNGEVFIEYSSMESDFNFDEIGAGLEAKKFQNEEKFLLENLGIWYITNFSEEGKWIKKLAMEVHKGRTIQEVLQQWKAEYSKEEWEKIISIVDRLKS